MFKREPVCCHFEATELTTAYNIHQTAYKYVKRKILL
jgi:hypothetical protein